MALQLATGSESDLDAIHALGEGWGGDALWPLPPFAQ